MYKFAAPQQTSTAKLPPFFEIFQSEERALRVNAVENKIPNVNDIVKKKRKKKTYFDVEISDI